MAGLCAGRVTIVTGAGQGLGREHALAFAAEGARLVVNDLGPAAEEVAAEIVAAGGEAVASAGDVSDWAYAAALVELAVGTYGQLDVLVNNAGLVRDRMLVTMSEAEWDFVVRVDLKGHFAPLRHAAAYWRNRAKEGAAVDARVVNTSSGAGLFGSVGQGNYAAAKAGVASLTQIAAVEMARYGVMVNAIAPSARTAMTEPVYGEAMRAPKQGFDAMHPGNVSPLVVWLGSVESGDVTGHIFEIESGKVSLADGWRHGSPTDKGDRWSPSELGPVVHDLIARSEPPTPVYGA